jgi:hypothetical protein
VGQLLEILVSPVGQLDVPLMELEILVAPESGHNHHGHEEHGQKVGGRRGRPGAGDKDEKSLGDGPEDEPDPPIELDSMKRRIRFCHRPLFHQRAQ